MKRAQMRLVALVAVALALWAWREARVGETIVRAVPRAAATVPVAARAPVPEPAGDVAWSRTALLALAAAREALAWAKLDPGAARVGVIVGGTTGGMLENELPIGAMFPDAAGAEPSAERRSHPLSSTADALAAALGPFARVRTLASACSSGASAIVVGAAWLMSGAVDAVLVGGAEALCRLTLTGFNSLGVVDPEPSRPFDRGRRGLNLGEGAGFLLLEREGAGRARGAAPIAELAGWALAAGAGGFGGAAAAGPGAFGARAGGACRKRSTEVCAPSSSKAGW